MVCILGDVGLLSFIQKLRFTDSIKTVGDVARINILSVEFNRYLTLLFGAVDGNSKNYGENVLALL